MRRPLWAGVLAALALPSASAWLLPMGCTTEITVRPRSDDGEGGDDPGEGGGGSGSFSTTAQGPDAGADAFDAWVDTPCENQPPPIEDYACDPYAQDNGACLEGEGCFIFVQYPAEPCGQEIYGAYCLPEGPGGQGDTCADQFGCQGGFVCVVTGAGTQCVQYCQLEGESGCPDGMICEQIDVEGFGGCL